MTGVNAGTTTVRVSSADNSINASCTVYVKIPDGVYYIKNAAVSKYLQNSGADAGVAAKDTSAETKYSQLWKITYVANGRYVIRPMDNTSKALTIGTSGYISVANATSNNAALTSSYLWSIGRDSDGIYFQQNGVSSKTITTYITNTTIIVYPNTYNTNTFCHWSLEDVKGIFLRDAETSEIITPNTVKYIELGESLSYSQLGINYEYYGSLIGGLTWLSSSSSILCLNVDQSDRDRGILVLAHELTHTYGIEHHSPVDNQPCIMDSNRYTANNPDDPTTYWCDNCIATISSNRNKY